MTAKEQLGLLTMEPTAAGIHAIAFCLVNEEGHRVFSDSTTKAIEKMDGRLAAWMTTQIAKHCQTLPITEDDVDDAEGN